MPLGIEKRAAIAEPGHGLYDLGVSGDWAPSQRSSESNGLRDRIYDLEDELERYRSQEQLLVKTLLSATNHAAAIRESARREAELTLRKARIEAERLKAGAERERDDASHELMRLRRITEQMRNGLSAFLTAKVEELQLETGEEAMPARQESEFEAALGSGLEGRTATELRSGAESASPTAGGSEPRRT